MPILFRLFAVNFFPFGDGTGAAPPPNPNTHDTQVARGDGEHTLGWAAISSSHLVVTQTTAPPDNPSRLLPLVATSTPRSTCAPTDGLHSTALSRVSVGRRVCCEFSNK